MKLEELFKVGDIIKLKDGDGRHHTIKSFLWEGEFATVIFEDDSAKGFICGTDTDMIKIS
jgi:hypothetical protein